MVASCLPLAAGGEFTQPSHHFVCPGIGRATALKFVEEGCAVIATDLNAEKLNEFTGVEGITTRRLDVTNDDDIKRLAQEFKVA